MNYWKEAMQNELQMYLTNKSQNSQQTNPQAQIGKLEAYFREIRLNISHNVKKLQQRLQECTNLNSIVEENVDYACSQIKHSIRNIDFQRYEDLLPCSFKQVQWTRSVRAGASADTEKLQTIDKYQKMLTQFQSQIQAIQQYQNRTIDQLQIIISSERAKQQQYKKTISQQFQMIQLENQNTLTQIERNFSHQLQTLENDYQLRFQFTLGKLNQQIQRFENEIKQLQLST